MLRGVIEGFVAGMAGCFAFAWMASNHPMWIVPAIVAIIGCFGIATWISQCFDNND